MPQAVHGDESPKPAAEERENEQGGLGDAPSANGGASFVVCVDGKRGHAH